MTERKEALERALKVATDGEKHVPTQIKAFTDAGISQSLAMRAMNGSLDAAEALHGAVLPEWTHLDHMRRGQRYTTYLSKSIEDEAVCGVSNSLARAWLIAILKVLIEQEQDQ